MSELFAPDSDGWTDPLEVADQVAAVFAALAARFAPEFGVVWPPADRGWLRAVFARMIDFGYIVTPERAAVLDAVVAARTRCHDLELVAALADFDTALLGPSVTCQELRAREHDWVSVEAAGLA